MTCFDLLLFVHFFHMHQIWRCASLSCFSLAASIFYPSSGSFTSPRWGWDVYEGPYLGRWYWGQNVDKVQCCLVCVWWNCKVYITVLRKSLFQCKESTDMIGLSPLIFDEWQSKQIKPQHANNEHGITKLHTICPIRWWAAGHNLPWTCSTSRDVICT